MIKNSGTERNGENRKELMIENYCEMGRPNVKTGMIINNKMFGF